MSNPNKPTIAVFSGASATIQNSPPLVTSNAARSKHGLPLLTGEDGAPLQFDVLRPQRLAAPVTVYVEAFSAHPLEGDAVELYTPPDGYLSPEGNFHSERRSAEDVPVYEVTLRPEDGPFMLPYMARQADGSAWDDDCAHPNSPAERCRQPFYPDAARMFDEIDRFGIGEAGVNNLLSSRARFDFYRAAPPGGYKKGLPEAARTDVGSGDVPPETLGEHFFPYRPRHIAQTPPMSKLADLTNMAQEALSGDKYQGAIWLEGSPHLEETMYWLNLLIDTAFPISGNASQRPHGQAANDGDRNIIDSVTYILSGIWADESGRDGVGGVVIQDEQIFTARDVEKGDARPGAFVATGGHGGIIGSMCTVGPPRLTFRPIKRHTHNSDVRITSLRDETSGTLAGEDGPRQVTVRVKDDKGTLLGTAIPRVGIVKHARYLQPNYSNDPDTEVEILSRIDANLAGFPLAGFVQEGATPYGSSDEVVEGALKRAIFRGMPVARVGRGSPQGITPTYPGSLFIAGSNLTATKARLLLMACLLKLGSLPLPANPADPTSDEVSAIRERIAAYQQIFDTH